MVSWEETSRLNCSECIRALPRKGTLSKDDGDILQWPLETTNDLHQCSALAHDFCSQSSALRWTDVNSKITNAVVGCKFASRASRNLPFSSLIATIWYINNRREIYWSLHMELPLVQGTWLQANLLLRHVGRQCRVAFLQYLVYNNANTASYTACNTNTVTYITCFTIYDYACHYSTHSYTTFNIIRHNKNKFKYAHFVIIDRIMIKNKSVLLS